MLFCFWLFEPLSQSDKTLALKTRSLIADFLPASLCFRWIKALTGKDSIIISICSRWDRSEINLLHRGAASKIVADEIVKIRFFVPPL